MTRTKTRSTTPMWVLITAIAIVLGVAVTYGASRPNVGRPRPPETSQGTPSVVIPTAQTDPLRPAPELPELSTIIAQLEEEHDALIGVAICPVQRSTTSAQATWEGGMIHSAPAYQTINLAIASAMLQDPKPSSDMDYLFNRALADGSDAAAESMWAYLGTPEEAAQKVTLALRASGDMDTVIPAQSDQDVPNYQLTGWSLKNQAEFVGAMACSTIQNFDVLRTLNDPQDDPVGLYLLPESHAIGGEGVNRNSRTVLRQTGTLVSADGVRVAVSVVVEVDDSATDGDALLTDLAYAIRDNATGFVAPTCS